MSGVLFAFSLSPFNSFSFSLSKVHKEAPWGMDVHGQRYEVSYWPGDSRSGMFGGNSNWRGPIWVSEEDYSSCNRFLN